MDQTWTQSTCETTMMVQAPTTPKMMTVIQHRVWEPSPSTTVTAWATSPCAMTTHPSIHATKMTQAPHPLEDADTGFQCLLEGINVGPKHVHDKIDVGP